MARDLGDFQTPLPLVHDILSVVMRAGTHWARVLEPTCGRGNFIMGILTLPQIPEEIQGIELQESYAAESRSSMQHASTTAITIHHANIFTMNLQRDLLWNTTGPLLVIGNPPWVTNAELGALESENLPRKSNIKRLAGIDAMTGSSNFDITETIIIKLMRELRDAQPTIALLCKTSVARNIIQFTAEHHLPFSQATIRTIDAQRWFHAAVDACLFTFQILPETYQYGAEIYTDLSSRIPSATLTVRENHLISDLLAYHHISHIDGISPLIWRQGIKHDAATVVELTTDYLGHFYNKQGEIVDIEEAYIYPLLKSSDVSGKEKNRPRRYVIVPHQHIGENTRLLANTAPRLWRYLQHHAEAFDKRKSSIYQNQAPFAYFGIGPYSFAPYKVAVSGMYKTPRFRAIGPLAGKPVMLDDTCYFLSCNTAEKAAIIVALLNLPLCQAFLQSVVFWDAKRPITKKVLQRIDLVAALQEVDRETLLQYAQIVVDTIDPQVGSHAHWPDNLVDVFTNDLPIQRQMTQSALW